MSCTIVRETLIEGALADVDAAHLRRCPHCAALVARVREAEDAVGRAVDTFAAGGDFDAAFARAVGTPPRRRSGLVVGAILLAAAAALALALPSAFERTVARPEVETPGLRPTVAEAPVPAVAAAPEPPPVEPPPAARSIRPPAPAPVVAPAAARTFASCMPGAGDEPPAGEQEALARRLAEIELHQRAFDGALTPAERSCLDEVRRTHPDRAGALTLLVRDAWAREDRARWAELAAELLALAPEPDLAYRLALHLSDAGPGSDAAVLRWSEVALAGQHTWTGATRKKRVAALLTVRAAARTRQLDQAVVACSGARPCAAADEARRSAEAAALEWVAYAREVGIDARIAERSCRSLVEDDDRCER